MNVVAAGSGAGFASTAFFARLYEEALALVRESRDYIAQRGRDDSRALPPTGGRRATTSRSVAATTAARCPPPAVSPTRSRPCA